MGTIQKYKKYKDDKLHNNDMHLMQTSGVDLDLYCFLVFNRLICMLLFFMVCIGDAGVISEKMNT